jgi:HSP20 family protein
LEKHRDREILPSGKLENLLLWGSQNQVRRKGVIGVLGPFRGFWGTQSQINRMFSVVLGSIARRPGSQRRGVTECAPAVDATVKDANLVVRAELRGVRPEDVDITLQDNVLTLSGERNAEQEKERGGYYIKERRYGSFSRSFTLPEGTDESKINTRFENGVLEVNTRGRWGSTRAQAYPDRGFEQLKAISP